MKFSFTQGISSTCLVLLRVPQQQFWHHGSPSTLGSLELGYKLTMILDLCSAFLFFVLKIKVQELTTC